MSRNENKHNATRQLFKKMKMSVTYSYETVPRKRNKDCSYRMNQCGKLVFALYHMYRGAVEMVENEEFWPQTPQGGNVNPLVKADLYSIS